MRRTAIATLPLRDDLSDGDKYVIGRELWRAVAPFLDPERGAEARINYRYEEISYRNNGQQIAHRASQERASSRPERFSQ